MTQGLTGLVHRHKCRGASSRQGERGSTQIQMVGDPCGKRRNLLTVDVALFRKKSFVTFLDPNIDSATYIFKPNTGVTRLFSGVPGDLKEESVARIHQIRLMRRNRKKPWIKQFNVL